MRRALAGRLGAALLGLALAAAACASTPTPTPTPTPAAPSAAPASATVPSDAPSATEPAGSGAVASPGAGPVENPALLAVLPATVGGQPVVQESQAFADAISDAAFAKNITEAAFGVVVAGNDLASAVVARPVDGVYSEAWFRDWRESYDEGACGQAGGLAATAEMTSAGRTVYVGTCAGGLKTYHAWLEGPGLLVSAFAVGENDWGSELMAGLRP